MLQVNLTSYKGELQLSLPDLFHLPLPTELSDEEHNERGEEVESALRQYIAEFCASRPFLSPKNGINILVYRNNIKSPTAIKFAFDEKTKAATGWTGLSAKVFLADRNEYEPDLFDILPVKMDE
tara:strand:+ start:19 stop:390 length:372 start_codon:yes stop_codon:yes gene_type:complete